MCQPLKNYIVNINKKIHFVFVCLKSKNSKKIYYLIKVKNKFIFIILLSQVLIFEGTKFNQLVRLLKEEVESVQ